jgi:CubicO group peptidase (beta-lactamase class C family)
MVTGRRSHETLRSKGRGVPISLIACLGSALARDSGGSQLRRPRQRHRHLSADRLARAVDAYVKPLIERGDLSGRLLVARGGTVLLERSFGFANRELRSPVTAESRFCVASVTKPMTVILTMGLIERKLIGYRDSIARWLPDFPHGDSITIEHLLRHRSGIPHALVPDSLATRLRSTTEMVETASRLPLDFPPGSKSSYSSGGFTVLARILEIASGKDYQTLLEEQIFGPLGMTHSRHASSAELLRDRVASYVPGRHGVENAPLEDFSVLVGAGSVWSTTRDLHRLVQAVIGGHFDPVVRASLVRGGKLDFAGRVTGFRAFAEGCASDQDHSHG